MGPTSSSASASCWNPVISDGKECFLKAGESAVNPGAAKALSITGVKSSFVMC